VRSGTRTERINYDLATPAASYSADRHDGSWESPGAMICGQFGSGVARSNAKAPADRLRGRSTARVIGVCITDGAVRGH
jgi:hypothetical protein